jgi:glutamyl-tRNA synthetase
VASLDELAERVELDRLSRAPATFDPAELDGLNHRVIGILPFTAVADRLADLGVGEGEAFWDAVRPNLEKLPDAADWWHRITGPLGTGADAADGPFLAQAAELLPAEPWNDETYSHWISAVKRETGRSGKALFRPVRLALTGVDHGPELRAILPLIGRAEAIARLSDRACSPDPRP